jgi:hypothetical protein
MRLPWKLASERLSWGMPKPWVNSWMAAPSTDDATLLKVVPSKLAKLELWTRG